MAAHGPSRTLCATVHVCVCTRMRPHAADADEPALVMEQSQVTIECSMQYTLKLDKLTDIYAAYELRYHDKMVKVRSRTVFAWYSGLLQRPVAWCRGEERPAHHQRAIWRRHLTRFRRLPMQSRTLCPTTCPPSSTRSVAKWPRICGMLLPLRWTHRTRCCKTSSCGVSRCDLRTTTT